MSTKFNMTRDINGYNGFGIQPTYDIEGCLLPTDTEKVFTVPSNYANWMVIFSYTPGANVFVSFTDTAAVPDNTVSSVTSVLNPAGRALSAGTSISVITPETTDVYMTVEYQVITPY